MEGGALFKEKYTVEPIPELVAITKFVQVKNAMLQIRRDYNLGEAYDSAIEQCKRAVSSPTL